MVAHPDTIEEFLNWWLPTPMVFEEFYRLVGARVKNLNPVLRWWLSQNTNLLRAGAMRAYWGSRYEVNFKQWLPTYIDQSEDRNKVALPKLPSTGTKTSGPTAFFGLTSAYAVGFVSREVLVMQLVNRFKNGIFWQLGEKDKREDLLYLGKRPTSIAPDFPPAFADFLLALEDLPWQDALVTAHGSDEDDN